MKRQVGPLALDNPAAEPRMTPKFMEVMIIMYTVM